MRYLGCVRCFRLLSLAIGLAIGIVIQLCWQTMPVFAQDQPGQGVHVTIIQSDSQQLVVEWRVDHFDITPVVPDGQTGWRITIPQAGQALEWDETMTPSHGIWLGVPTLRGLTLQVREAEYEMLPADYRPLARTMKEERAALSEPVASSDPRDTGDGLPPSSIAQLGYAGYVREQPMTQVQFYPLRYAPHGQEVRLYRRIVVQLKWDDPIKAADADHAPRTVNPLFARLLQHTLANGDALMQTPLQTTAPLPPLEEVSPAGIPATAPPPRWKLEVVKDGVYHLAYADLQDMGFDVDAVDPRRVQIYHRGAEISLYVYGEADGRFDDEDHILFYGEAIRDLYTASNVYWLTIGDAAGRRMAVHRGQEADDGRVPSLFQTTLHAEENDNYWQSMPHGHGEDHWFWGPRLSPHTEGLNAAQSYTVTLGHVAPDADGATVRVQLKGFTTKGHRTRIYLNDSQIDDQPWSGQGNFTHTTAVRHSLLLSGTNVVRVEAVDVGETVDQILVDWIEIEYWHTYSAIDNSLQFSMPNVGAQRVQIDGFRCAEISIFDISDPAHPARWETVSILPQGNRCTADVALTARAQSQYLALASTRYKTPQSITLDQPSHWRTPAHGADYIVITHRDFYTAAARLAEYRRVTDGLRVVTIPVDDLYDELSDGLFTPDAIRAFLIYAYHHWQPPAPSYVLLVGDAYQDYQDRLKTGTINYVPTQIVETALFGETPSDNWFVTVSGDDILPDMLIGRLVAQSAAEAEQMVTNIIQHQQRSTARPSGNQMLLVADNDEPAFTTLSDALVTQAPANYTFHKVYASTYPPGDPAQDIAFWINQGVEFVNYAGHGEHARWGRWDDERATLWDGSHIESLQNVNRLPIVTIANCLNGFFSGSTHSEALAEIFQRQPNRGAVAIWAPSGLGFPTGHRTLISAFYAAVWQREAPTMGEATVAAKLDTFAQSPAWADLVETYILFGDPALPFLPEDEYAPATPPYHSYLPLMIQGGNPSHSLGHENALPD